MKRELLPFIVAGEEKIIQQEGETRPVRSRGSPNAHYPQNNSHTSHTHTHQQPPLDNQVGVA